MVKVEKEGEKEGKAVVFVSDCDFYLMEHAAQKLGVTVRYIRDAVSEGNLKGFKLGRRFYILHTDLLAYLKKAGKDAKEAQANNPTKNNKPTNQPTNKAKK